MNIYLDLSKAFDTINFDVLLYKLKYYGVTGTSYNLIENYLTNRMQYVKFNTHESSKKTICTGVPQGSILGPLLFSIYINDLVTVGDKFNYLMYADDTTIYFKLEDFPNNMENCISNELNQISTWLKCNKLSLNVDKTKCITFHTRQKQIPEIHFSINNTPIENVKSFKFLGIYFNSNLTWKNHIDMVSNKLSKVIGIFKRLRYVYPEQVLLTIYNSLFVSHINYGLLVWGVELDRIYMLQKKAVRIVTGNDYIAHTEPIFKSLELLKVEHLFNVKILKFYYNLLHNCLPVYFNKYLNVINCDLPHSYQLRRNARPEIRLPRIHHVFAESSLLYQLINLVNCMHEQHPEILLKIVNKSHILSGVAHNITRIYIDTYKYECDLRYCYKCGRF